MTTHKKPREIANELNVSRGFVYSAQRMVANTLSEMHDPDGIHRKKEQQRLRRWKKREKLYTGMVKQMGTYIQKNGQRRVSP